MAIPFYYNPATNELELTADPSPLRDSLGTRFGLNEISTARKTLSPIKSYTAESVMPSQFDEISIEEMEDLKKQVKFGPQVKDGGRIDMKPGGIVEPGVTHYAVLTDAEKADNIKAWEKNTDLKFKDIEDKSKRSKIRTGVLEGTVETAAVKGSLEKSVWLKGYSYDDFLKDLKKGKTSYQIAEDLYEKNPEYFDNLKKTRRLKETTYTRISTALTDRLRKKPELVKLNKLNEKNFLVKEKLALKEVKEFIEKNKEAYKKVYASRKIGAVTNFKEKVLDFISKKYPELLTRAKGGRDIIFGQRLFSSYHLLGRDVTRAGEYGLDIALNKEIRKALGIPERPSKGEGQTLERWTKEYNKNITKLLKTAQDRDLIPKIDPTTGAKIKDVDSLYRYVKRTQIDPIRKLFGNKFNFGQEHIGGVSRALVVNDVESLTRITAMDPVQNLWVKGPKWDTRISNLMKLAKQTSGTVAQGYIDQVNELIAKADKKFGLEQTKYKIVKDEIIPIQPKASLEDSLYKKAQRALKTFVATKRFKEPNFKLLPEELKEAINFLKKGDIDKSNQFLKTAVNKYLNIAKTTKGPPRLKALQMLAYIGGGGILAGLGLNITSAEAKTLEPSDKKQEAGISGDVAKGLTYGTLGTIAANYPKEVWEGAKKVLTKTGSGFEKVIRPLFIPAVDVGAALVDTPITDKEHHRDVTSPTFWMTKAFWAGAMDKYGITKTYSMLKNTPDFTGKAKIARDIFLRAGINPAAVRFISSKVAWPATAAASVYDAYKDYQKRKPDVEKQKELIEQGVVKEEEFDKEEPMFAMGGIASLIK